MNNEREKQMMGEAAVYVLSVMDHVYSGTEFAKAINDFCAGWRAADNSRWIPFEERLPKEQGKYMFRLSNGDMCYETYYPKLKLLGNVTHWMPIVPPRKEDKK
jgi:hypothetical protein